MDRMSRRQTVFDEHTAICEASQWPMWAALANWVELCVSRRELATISIRPDLP